MDMFIGMYGFDMRKLMTYTKGIILNYLSIVFSFFNFYVYSPFTHSFALCHLFFRSGVCVCARDFRFVVEHHHHRIWF